MGKYSNRVVWITGASSGIGEATAYEFAKEDAILILSARRADALERVKQQTGLPASQVLVLPMDVTKIETFPVLVQQVLSAYGRIDVLYNNAGISQRGSVIDTDFGVYRELMEINFFGVIALTRAVLPTMIAQKSGRIAVTSSVSGKLGTPMRSGYCASKHALHGFFDSLRSEVYRDNISVTIVCPGYIKTDISYKALNADGTPHGRMDNNQATGMDAATCAKRIYKAIDARREEAYMGGKEILGVYLKRFFPLLLSRRLRFEMPR